MNRGISKLKKMTSNGFTDSEKSQCVLRTADIYGWLAFPRRFSTQYQKAAPARSGITGSYDEYQPRGDHSHRGGNVRPQRIGI